MPTALNIGRGLRRQTRAPSSQSIGLHDLSSDSDRMRMQYSVQLWSERCAVWVFGQVTTAGMVGLSDQHPVDSIFGIIREAVWDISIVWLQIARRSEARTAIGSERSPLCGSCDDFGTILFPVHRFTRLRSAASLCSCQFFS